LEKATNQLVQTVKATYGNNIDVENELNDYYSSLPNIIKTLRQVYSYSYKKEKTNKNNLSFDQDYHFWHYNNDDILTDKVGFCNGADSSIVVWLCRWGLFAVGLKVCMSI
jgi:hypothetical protein